MDLHCIYLGNLKSVSSLTLKKNDSISSWNLRVSCHVLSIVITPDKDKVDDDDDDGFFRDPGIIT